MYKILIVEDDRVIADKMKEHLEKWDYEVACVQDFKRVQEEYTAFDPQLVLRRAYSFTGQLNVLEYRDVILNLNDAAVTFHGERMELTKNDFKILQILMENAGKIVKRDRIMERLWESDEFIDDNTLTVNMTRLRKKLESIGICDFIATKKGIGYVIE